MPYPKKSYFIAGLISLLVLGFLTTSVVSYLVTEDSLSDRIAEEALPLTSDNIYSEIERDLLRSILISSLMAQDTFVRDWSLDGEKNPERIIRYLEQIQERYRTTTSFFISDRTYRYYHPDGIVKTLDSEAPADAWYFRVRDINDHYEINIDWDTADRDRLSIFINYRVVDYEGNFLGVTGIGLSVNSVAELIESYQSRYGRQIYFVDREGSITVRGSDIAGANRIQDRPGLEKMSMHILTSPSTSLTYTKPDGEKVYVNSRLVPEFDWYLIVEQAESASNTRILNTLFINIGVALVITALVLAIAWFSVRGYQQKLEEMATTDKLTGAANRHVFEMIFKHDTASAMRRGDSVSLITVDIDRFKEINDTYGHAGGDAVLSGFAAIVREYFRDSDTFCRWGGDEFLILMSDCDLDCATKAAERIREAVRHHPFQFGSKQIPVTLSIGIARHLPHEELTELLKRADTALYASKNRGRDQVSLA
ncbi:sensor domain-containing diguanylate cyclase [Thiohalomonas denitrificans]|uniref:diguanylate cyclase n=1 Tax=Thiohalomonas denitrificans TaxID=415747 RepID=A0A1G5QQJ4_9GAMM|nr:sensor domain-containing diguanylate cyclase [Thiohalomonas denitrificans]SCZ64103.1 diguanylate cyclase (GGDEF) domain-containing protein [Thiohalomonas denitrificans]